MLGEILELEDQPVLKPAYVSGYALRLWGQYPVLVSGEQDCIVEGHAYEVPNEVAATRLAEYEGKTYRPTPCLIQVKDGNKEEPIRGFTFMYCGRESALDDGTFDLAVWLRRMGR